MCNDDLDRKWIPRYVSHDSMRESQRRSLIQSDLRLGLHIFNRAIDMSLTRKCQSAVFITKGNSAGDNDYSSSAIPNRMHFSLWRNVWIRQGVVARTARTVFAGNAMGKSDGRV